MVYLESMSRHCSDSLNPSIFPFQVLANETALLKPLDFKKNLPEKFAFTTLPFLQ
jgi:hypothetical protein